MIVYLARDIPAFVMYCVNGESGSSLLIESTDSMISPAVFTYLRFYTNLTQTAPHNRLALDLTEVAWITVYTLRTNNCKIAKINTR